MAAGAAFSVDQREGADALVVPVHVVMVVVTVTARALLRVGLEREPARDIGNLALGIVEAAGEKPRGCRLARGHVEERRGRVERAQARQQCLVRIAAFGRIDEVGLAQHDAVGHRGLLDGFEMRVERGGAIHRVDHRDDAVEPVAHRQIGMGHCGLQHGRRIGEAGRFQHHAAETHAAVVEIAQKLLQRIDEVAAQRAAQAAALQQHDAVPDLADQQMIEADFAEFIDDDGGLGERRVSDQAIEQRCLAGAKKAGQHGQRNGLGRAQVSRRTAGHRVWAACGGVCVDSVVFGAGGFLGLGFAAGALSDCAADFGVPSAFFAAGLISVGLAPAGLVAAVLASPFGLAAFLGFRSEGSGRIGSPGLRAGPVYTTTGGALPPASSIGSAPLPSPLAFGRRLARKTP